MVFGAHSKHAVSELNGTEGHPAGVTELHDVCEIHTCGIRATQRVTVARGERKTHRRGLSNLYNFQKKKDKFPLIMLSHCSIVIF